MTKGVMQSGIARPTVHLKTEIYSLAVEPILMPKKALNLPISRARFILFLVRRLTLILLQVLLMCSQPKN